MTRDDLIERVAIEAFNAHLHALGVPPVTSLDKVHTAEHFRAAAVRILRMVLAGGCSASVNAGW